MKRGWWSYYGVLQRSDSRAVDIVVFAEDVVGALGTDDGPITRVEELRA